jgi:TRAP-type mannitol/chloroaromatic compound transport system permease small subunit
MGITEDTDKKSEVSNLTDRVILGVGHAAAWLIAVLIVTILVQVVLRYVFHLSFTALEEIQWHLYAVIIMIGLSYSYVKDSHIRLDILHSRLSRPVREKIEIMGIICLLWPMLFIIFMHSLDFVAESFRVGERSDAPMGLGYRWAIKSIIPIAFFLLFLGSVSRLKQAFEYLKKRKASHGS